MKVSSVPLVYCVTNKKTKRLYKRLFEEVNAKLREAPKSCMTYIGKDSVPDELIPEFTAGCGADAFIRDQLLTERSRDDNASNKNQIGARICHAIPARASFNSLLNQVNYGYTDALGGFPRYAVPAAHKYHCPARTPSTAMPFSS
ncbi:hypothetical protein QR680_019175 [Steinernema hermaphroditum]|uniref:Uncharacterized protein n=1 Tax=Steinernema hermaphroditum TaxID=289476 RepID=A0AA39HLI5_9BILA|nr:hypothetical protein QR680_019175 [Steinernema hermaphroditum]